MGYKINILEIKERNYDQHFDKDETEIYISALIDDFYSLEKDTQIQRKRSHLVIKAIKNFE